ncbi:hypothetical protein [Desulfobulbus alkaliphilus]|uniref:hypothetical protein n=1 Tax=Desulfobulbus alkaliphilus TaxID=869814 RepID=UPI0019655EA9|nr:hypothetical protein [Desulfobulbus alkaliphilus]
MLAARYIKKRVQPSRIQETVTSAPRPGSLPIDIFSIADFDHPYRQFVILDRVYDTIISLTDAVQFKAGEFFAAHGPEIVSELLNP